MSTTKLKSAESNKGGDGYWIASKALKYDEDEDTGIFKSFEYLFPNRFSPTSKKQECKVQMNLALLFHFPLFYFPKPSRVSSVGKSSQVLSVICTMRLLSLSR